MRIAIPIADGRLCPHFGHCDDFAMIEADPEKKEILATELLRPPPHEPGVLPRWLQEQRADVVIAGGMGPRAEQLLAQNGVTVVIGASGRTAEELVVAYLNGTLQTGANICDH